jgi:hypothetical protein
VKRPLLCLLLAALPVPGCYWQRYDELVRTHVELLVAMAGKMEWVLASQDATKRMSMNEYRYPLDRARDFARIVRERYGNTESFRRFETFLDRYETLLTHADRLRVARAEPRGFREELRQLQRAGAEVLESLNSSAARTPSSDP